MENLDHIISRKGASTDPSKVAAKVAAIVAWSIPKTIKELRGFLGLTDYYRKFVTNSGILSKPLTNLLEKNARCG